MRSRVERWPAHFGLILLDALTVRCLAPTGAVGVAWLVQSKAWGLRPWVEGTLPGWFVTTLTVVLLDLVIYFQHRLFHSNPWLWRIHRMHHTDVDLDATSGNRFHPIEIVLSFALKCIVIGILGASPWAVLLFEIQLNAAAMFNHSNVRLPDSVDRWLRWVLVTPDMHRVHHSTQWVETDSNFGFSLPWWDRLFRTYRAQPSKGHEAMQIGLDVFRAPEESRLDRLLTQPFRVDATHDDRPADSKSSASV